MENLEQLNQFLLRQIELLSQIEENTRPKTRKVRKKPEDILSIEPYRDKYTQRMLIEFMDYWTEADRWKKEKSWDTGRRLERWKKNQEKWDDKKEVAYSLPEWEPPE